jgi:hypothetical protein
MGMNSPGTILKLWTKTVKKLDDGKKPADPPKKGNEQKLKIKTSLTALKFEAPAARTNPAPFIKKRDKSALLLRKFCRYLKTAKDEDRKVTQRSLKTVMGLAVVVQNLDPGSLDLSEEEGSLEALDAQDTSALAAALEKPDTEADVAEEPMPEDMAPGRTATPAATDPAVEYRAKLAEWTPAIKAALAAKGPSAADIAKLLAQATALSKPGGDMAQALAKLMQCHALATGPQSTQPVPPAPNGPDKAAVVKRLTALAGSYQWAVTQQGPDVPRLQALFGQIKGLLARKDFNQADFDEAGRLLGELESLLARATPKAGADNQPPEGNVIFTQSRLVWDVTRKKVRTELDGLARAVRTTCQKWNKDPNFTHEVNLGKLETGLKNFNRILERLDTRLNDKLDEAVNAMNAGERQVKRAEAKGLVQEYLSFTNGDPLLAVIDQNGFLATKVRASVLATLTALSSKL